MRLSRVSQVTRVPLLDIQDRLAELEHLVPFVRDTLQAGLVNLRKQVSDIMAKKMMADLAKLRKDAQSIKKKQKPMKATKATKAPKSKAMKTKK